jgi:hypothetical protein
MESGKVRYQYRTREFASVFKREAMALLNILQIVIPQACHFVVLTKSVLICLKERSLTKKHFVVILMLMEQEKVITFT